MQQLSDEGQRAVAEVARRHGLSTDAVTQMLFAVLAGNGSMAQFNIPELGGSGQWMRGGMTMVGDMFNHGLKAQVDNLCNDLAGMLASQPGLLQQGSFQSQSQGGGGYAQAQGSGAGQGQAQGGGLFVPGTGPNDWWPAGLGQANATGSQNNVRYAWFAGARRLAVDTGGEVWVYDTLDHQIGGFSQQQGGSGSISFSSQYGYVDLSRLPVVMKNGQPVTAAMPTPPAGPGMTGDASAADVYASIERLGDLKAKGLLSEEEFAAKKAELLGRL